MMAPAAASIALVACSSDTPPAGNAQAQEDQSPAAMQARLEALSEAQRNGVFMRAVRDAGQECQHVERSERAGDHNGLPLWRAWCEGETSYTIVITRSGTAQVLADADVRLIHEAPPKEGTRGQ